MLRQRVVCCRDVVLATLIGGDRMGRIFRSLAMLAWVSGLLGCQSFNVRSDWDPAIAFPRFQEYFWVDPPERENANPFADNSLLRKRIRVSLEGALAERGFRASESREGVDFLVSYSVLLEERLKVDQLGTTTGAIRSRYAGVGVIHSTSTVQAYQESTLIIDFLDPKNDDLVWRGWGTGIVRTRDRGRRDQYLDKGIAAILDVFPPNVEDEDAR